MKILKNKLGFTLVELMVGLAATGIVSLGIANLTSEQVKDQKYLETKNEEVNVRDVSGGCGYNACN